MRFPSVAAVCVLLASCSESSSAPPPGTLLEPLPGTGVQSIEMRGTWQVAAVEVLNEFTQPGPNPSPSVPFGLVPPVVGDLITIDEREFHAGADRPLLRHECEATGNVVSVYYNQTDGRFAIYNMDCHTRPDPKVADGGGLHFRMAFGTISRNTLLGLVDFDRYGALPPGTLLAGTYRVRLERVS